MRATKPQHSYTQHAGFTDHSRLDELAKIYAEGFSGPRWYETWDATLLI